MVYATDRVLTIVNQTSVTLVYYTWVEKFWPWDDNWQYAWGNSILEQQVIKPGKSLTIPVGLLQRCGSTSTGRYYGKIKVVRQSDVISPFYDIKNGADESEIIVYEDKPMLVVYMKTDAANKLQYTYASSSSDPSIHIPPPTIQIGTNTDNPYESLEPEVDESFDVVDDPVISTTHDEKSTFTELFAQFLKEQFGIEINPKDIIPLLIGIITIPIILGLLFVLLLRR